MRTAAVISLLLAAPLSASAQPAVENFVASGKRKVAVAEAQQALRQLEPTLELCWKGAPASVAVEVVVTDGAVSKTSPVGDGKWAACAAGVLRMAEFADAPSWSGRVVFAGKSREQAITDAFAQAGAGFRACQADDPGAKGALSLELQISAAGVVTAANASGLASKKISACAAAHAKTVSVPTGGKAIKYRLGLSYTRKISGPATGSSGAASTTADAGGSGPVGVSITGSHSAADIKQALSGAAASLAGCHKSKSSGLTLGFTVRANGTTKNITVKGAQPVKPAVEDCLRKLAASWTFAAAEGETRVQVPL